MWVVTCRVHTLNRESTICIVIRNIVTLFVSQPFHQLFFKLSLNTGMCLLRTHYSTAQHLVPIQAFAVVSHDCNQNQCVEQTKMSYRWPSTPLSWLSWWWGLEGWEPWWTMWAAPRATPDCLASWLWATLLPSLKRWHSVSSPRRGW